MKRWKISETDPAVVRNITAETGLSRPVAAAMVARGYEDPEEVNRFLHPRLSGMRDPFDLPDMEKGVDRVWKAILDDQVIVVFGDYDVDGIASTALMIRILRNLGANAMPFLPHRIEDGYGLSIDALTRCIETLKPDLIITVDCGTGSVESVLMAKEKGMDVVITDHHEPQGEIAPAYAVINPKRNKTVHDSELAGVGVAFKVCHAILKKGREMGYPETENVDLKEYIDLVGLGTISDIVPLKGENRTLAKYGLNWMDKTMSVGLKALKKVSGLKGSIQSHHIGFALGPRLNAAGRMGTAEVALDLLLTDDDEHAAELAMALDRENRNRQATEQKATSDAMREVEGQFREEETFSFVVANEDWHPGVVGIVASRIVDRYYRPAVVIAINEQGVGKGSCRSIAGFNLIDHLESCSDLLVKFGGHTMAAGLEIHKTNIEAFCRRFNEVCRLTLQHEDLRPVQRIDSWIGMDEIDFPLLDALDRLQPYGHGNPVPVFACKDVRTLGPPEVVGKGHLKLYLTAGGVDRESIGFGLGDLKVPDGPMDVAFQVKRNIFRGRESIQMNLVDFRPAGETFRDEN